MSSEVKELDITQLIISEEVKPSDKKDFLVDEQFTTLETQTHDSETLTAQSEGEGVPEPIASDPPYAPNAWSEIDKYFNAQVQQVQQTTLEAEQGIPVDSPRQPRENDAGEEFQAGVPAHPYLLKSQQYDGISDENPDISRITDPERRIEVQNELRKNNELKHDLSHEHTNSNVPKNRPGG